MKICHRLFRLFPEKHQDKSFINQKTGREGSEHVSKLKYFKKYKCSGSVVTYRLFDHHRNQELSPARRMYPSRYPRNYLNRKIYGVSNKRVTCDEKVSMVLLRKVLVEQPCWIWIVAAGHSHCRHWVWCHPQYVTILVEKLTRSRLSVHFITLWDTEESSFIYNVYRRYRYPHCLL